MNTTKTQLRGICQCCGRDQAVVSGRMSKHGYTVEEGWFSGICTGQRYAPLQVSREQADRIIAQVREECDELDRRVESLRAGTSHPNTVKTDRWDPKTRESVHISWEEATPYQRTRAVENLCWGLKHRAEQGRSFATALEQTADRVHGTELRVVPVEAGPEPILRGEVRNLPNGRTATVTSVDGARICWTDSKGFRGWTGSTRWRKFPKAA